ncbi:Crp/Fnr family transcriptional regulator [Roseibium aggregatum]|uniref:Crp/Fnr family transcriptional regulator n=1 Tax=Roseibium aggregatum TaxID=187304 RepID=A0A939J5V2_9HYPH|nr:Crp/Fnr family transcriptional regulator [Roseibium aggregatum]MBN9672630.1 Crp/Fnr family transcriptional regulator [Roseibium aggregatum]
MGEELVKVIPFAKGMQADTFAALKKDITRTVVSPGEDILRPGDTVGGVFLVKSGAIRVYYIDAEGREGTLYWIGPGESCILALNSLFSDMPYPAFAAADTEGVEFLTLSGKTFRQLFARDPAVQAFLFEQLSGRVYALLSTLEQTMRLPQEERLVLLLLARADESGVICLSQERLARDLGTHREVVSRLLRNLAGQNLISLAHKRITIMDRSRLEAMLPADGPDG